MIQVFIPEIRVKVIILIKRKQVKVIRANKQVKVICTLTNEFQLI